MNVKVSVEGVGIEEFRHLATAEMFVKFAAGMGYTASIIAEDPPQSSDDKAVLSENEPENEK
jgi:hypothetical protein